MLPEVVLPAGAVHQVAEALAIVASALTTTSGSDLAATRSEIQARMSDQAGFLCRTAEVPPALAAACRLRESVLARGFACPRAAQVVDIFRWRQMTLTSEAVLTALAHYLAQGGGSRGARAYLSAQGTCVPQGRRGTLEDFRFLVEREADRRHKLVLRWTGTSFAITARELRDIEDLGRIFFEKNWSPFLTGNIQQPGFRHG